MNQEEKKIISTEEAMSEHELTDEQIEQVAGGIFSQSQCNIPTYVKKER